MATEWFVYWAFAHIGACHVYGVLLCVQAGLGLDAAIERVGREMLHALTGLALRASSSHADALRTQRRLRAEEAAAKLPVKLLIPLIFCVFPSLLTVLLGPVVVTLARQFVKVV